MNAGENAPPSLIGSVLRGALGFAAVSLVAFGIWAFAGKTLQSRLGEAGFYAVLALAFLGLSGLALHPLARGPRSFLRFTRAFVPAFLGYAAAWCGAWFALRFGKGEWLGSLAGSLVFTAILGAALGSLRGYLRAALVFFIAHSAGYFLGGPIFYHLKSVGGQLIWGLLYGLGFGAGMGYAFHTFQKTPKT